MTDLLLHRRPVGTVFDLLGDQENDLTFSVGWVLAKSPAFCRAFLRKAFGKQPVGRVKAVHLQAHGDDAGYTDIEIVTERAHLIVEAKRGWNLPLPKQLKRYASRFETGIPFEALAVLSECSPEYARPPRLPARLRKRPVVHVSWKDVAEIAAANRANGAIHERRLLHELDTYLRGLISMQNQDSNQVYLVVLSVERAYKSELTWIDIVTKKHRYFHPFGGNGWPTTPPNYLGFRYKGQLQSIHHVDGYEIVEYLPDRFPEFDPRYYRPSKTGNPHIVYRLGAPIRPPRIVRNGGIFATGRLWAALDLLLTSGTIKQAVDLTKKRLAKVK